MKKAGYQKGFSLIELIIYLAIVSGVVLSMVLFSLSVSGSRAKTYVAQEVQANARVALNIISQKIKLANGVNMGVSIFGLDPGVLSLSMADAAKNPTVIDLDQDNGVLQIKEGVSSPVAITSDEVKVTNLVFTNLTSTGARENIRIEFTVEYNNPSGDIRYDHSRSLQTAVSLRQ